MTLLIDSRAGSKEFIHQPSLRKDAELSLLDSGDVLIAGNGPNGDVLVGIEIKSMSDLISSMNTGRLQGTQIPRMLNDFDVVWVLHYGRYRPCPATGTLQIQGRYNRWNNYKIGSRLVPYGYVESFLLTLNALGVSTKRVESEHEAAQWIAVQYRWWSKPWEKHKGLHSFDNSRNVSLLPGLSEAKSRIAKVAAQLPCIGFGRAVEVAKHFDSIEQMVMAPQEEWESIPGIGKVTAQAVRDTIGG